MKVFKVVLVGSIALAILFAFNLFAATPTPTPVIGTPTPTLRPATPTPTIRLATPTPTRTATPTPRRVTPTPRYGSWISISWTNNTDHEINDLELYFRGYISITTWIWEFRGMTIPFQSYTPTYDPVNNVTKIRWYNGTIAPGQTIYICWWGIDIEIFFQALLGFTVDGTVVLEVPIFSYYYHYYESHLIYFSLINSPVNGGPVTIGTIQVGFINTIYSFSSLVWNNLNSLSWYSTENNIQLNKDDAKIYTDLPMPTSAVGMIYRARFNLDSDPNNVVEFIGQYVPSPSPTPTPTPPQSGYAVNYAIQSDWGSGATVSVTITNNTSTAVNGWTLAWAFPGNQTITNLWSGTYTQSGASVSAHDGGFNANIAANGGSVNFGFNMNYSGTNAKPTSFTLNGTACQVQ